MSKLITVFEHNRLEVDEAYGGVLFTAKHFEALATFNAQHESRFFTVENKKIKFNQYVGVIAVHGITIEVLPKPDGVEDEARWQKALIDMLKVAHGLPLHDAGHAQLALRRTSVLEYFLRLFVNEVRDLVHRGLVKRYRKQAGVTTALKGRLDLPRHIRGSIVHKERFHVVHQVYDTDHLIHSILKRALTVVAQATNDPITKGGAQDVLWAFEHVADKAITVKSFEHLNLDRKTKGYSNALVLAKLLLLNLAPTVKGGQEHIISLLFDMNRLFEAVVLKLLLRAARDREDIRITGQTWREFWNGQGIKPDILVYRNKELACVIDTKWKLPKDNKPAGPDLKQMYAYNLQFKASESILLYPAVGVEDLASEKYAPTKSHDHLHGCSVRYIWLFDEYGKVDPNAVSKWLAKVVPSLVIQASTLSR